MLGIILQLFLVIYKDYLDLTGVLHRELVYLFLSLQWELPNLCSLESASNTCSNCLDCFLLQHYNYLKTRKTFQSAEERQLIWRQADLGLNHDLLLAVQLECIVYHQGEINDYSRKQKKSSYYELRWWCPDHSSPRHTEEQLHKGSNQKKICSHLALLWSCRLRHWLLWCTLSWVSWVPCHVFLLEHSARTIGLSLQKCTYFHFLEKLSPIFTQTCNHC